MPTRPEMKNFYLPMGRHHVTAGSRWAHEVGTDYWLHPTSGLDQFAAASTATGDELAENGWTATSLVNTAGSGSDFRGGVLTQIGATKKPATRFPGTYADAGTPTHALSNATGDLLLSPAIFGDAANMEAAAILAGKSKLPDYLLADFWAAFTVANTASEPRTSIGFYEDGCTDSTVEADQYAAIQSDGTNFLLAGNAAAMSTGALISTGWHRWRIVLEFNGATGPNCWWYIDGTLQSTTPGVGAQDEFPLHFGFGALTTNRIGVGLVHCYYDWA